MIEKIKNISNRVLLAARTYPLVLLSSLTTVILLISLIEFENRLDEFIVAKLAICSSLGIAILFSVKMLSQRIKREFLWSAIGILILVGYYFILPSNKDDFDEVYVYVLLPTVVLVHLFVSFAAFILSNSETKFWQYNKNLFINFILSLLFTGVLTLGVVLALLAVQNLFAIDLDEKLYGETALFLGIFGNTLIFLLFNGNGIDDLENDTQYPVVLKFFTQFILIPLLLLYVVILYFYAAKILISWELPQGWVSYLILAYALLGILALLLVHPLRNDSARSWVRIFSTAFYYSLIPLIILLFTAIFTRILEYGYTEPRYYVLLLAVWLLTIQLYFIFYKKTTIKFIPMSLFAFGIFALVFPFLNSFSVAIRSQKNQLENILVSNNLLKEGTINFDKEISDTTMRSIVDKYEFLSIRNQQDYLNGFLPDTLVNKERYGKRIYIGSYFNNISAVETENNRYLNITNSTKLQTVADYDFVAFENQLLNESLTLGTDKLEITKRLYGSDNEYSISLQTGEKVDLLPLINQLVKKYEHSEGQVIVDDLSIETMLGNYTVKIVFDQINRYNNNDANPYYFDNALVLIKIKD